MSGRSLAAACICACVLAGCAGSLTAAVDARFDAAGLTEVRHNDQTWPVDRPLTVRKVAFRTNDGKLVNAELGKPEASFDADRRTLTLAYDWGRVTCTYATKGNRLNLVVTVHNQSDRTLHQIAMDLLDLRVGPGLSGGGSHHNIGAPTVLTAAWDAGTVAVCNEQLDAPLTLALRTDKQTLRTDLTAGGDRMVYDALYVRRPIAPAKRDRYEISLRFGDADADPLDLGQDRFDAFAKAHPRVLDWPDRRPINRLFFGGGWPKEKINQYFKDPDSVELPTEAPEDFRKKRLASVDRAIAAAKQIGAQGIIIWDIEGGSFPHAITYIGDPRLTYVFNPHMNAIADEIFKRIHDAGLHAGVTLRPSQIVYEPEQGQINQRYGPVLEKYPDDPVFEQLNAKIEYCRKRWGTRLYYVDTPIFWRPRGPEKKWTHGLITADVWRRLLEKHPDILIIPEFSYAQCMAYTVAYAEYDMGFRGTAERMRRIYPECWTCAVIEDEDPYERFDQMVSDVRGGDSLQTFIYGLHGYARAQKYIYQEAAYLDAGEPEAAKTAEAAQLVELLGSDDGRTQFFAAARLGDLEAPGEAAIDALIAAVEDADRDWLVRKQAVESLGRLEAERAIQPLAGLLGEDSDHLAAFAGDALVAIGKPAAAALMPRVKAGQKYAIKAIGRIGEPAAAALLIEFARGKDRGVRSPAIEALGHIASDAAVAVLIDMVNDVEVGYTRCAAANALATTGRADARAALVEARSKAQAAGDQNHFVWCIGRALGRMPDKAEP